MIPFDAWFEDWVNALCSHALVRLHRRIEERAQRALGRPEATIHRSTGQLYGAAAREQQDYDDVFKRAREAREAALRG